MERVPKANRVGRNELRAEAQVSTPDRAPVEGEGTGIKPVLEAPSLARAQRLGHSMDRLLMPSLDSARTSLAATTALPARAPNLVQRELVAQVTPQEPGEAGGERRIGEVSIQGRPDSPFTSTMGDHATAFAVHRKSLQQKLRGTTFREAFQILRETFEAAQGLPGVALVGDLPAKHREHYDGALDALRALLYDDGGVAQDPAPFALQEAIGTYLQYRELIPLSLINVRVKAPEHAGKGKGEAGPANLLESHQREGGVAANERLNAVVETFDLDSAGLAAVEGNPALAPRMLPGLDPGLTFEARRDLLIAQHLASVWQAFPRTFEEGLTHDEAETRLRRDLTESMAAWLDAKAVDAVRQQFSLSRQIQTSQIDLVVSRGPKQKERLRRWITTLQEQRAQQENRQEAAAQAYEALTGTAWTYEPPGTEMEPQRERKKRRLTAPDVVAMDEAENESANAEFEGTDTLANQLRFGADGRIEGMSSAGRSVSPFPGTMGAHSTAWVVHLDHLRREIQGLSLAEAWDRVEDVLIPAATTLKETRVEDDLFTMDQRHRELYQRQIAVLADLKAQRADVPDDLLPYLLQNYLNAYLGLVNLVPGATLEKADTGGKLEGSYRGRLRDFEAGGEQYVSTLTTAIDGLLDIAGTLPGQATQLSADHRAIIRATYPKAAAAVFDGERAPEEVRARILPPRNASNRLKRKRSEWE